MSNLSVIDSLLDNAADIMAAASKADLPLAAACALMQKESGGRNVYGHDAGGALAGYPGLVNKGNWEVFRWMIIDKGMQSNGVGPAQLTFKGFFLDMEKQGLRPWVTEDNMLYGFRLLKKYRDDAKDQKDPHPWIAAGARYNGAHDYGVDLAAKIKAWRTRLA